MRRLETIGELSKEYFNDNDINKRHKDKYDAVFKCFSLGTEEMRKDAVIREHEKREMKTKHSKN